MSEIDRLHPIQYQWQQLELPDGKDTAKVPTKYFSDDTDFERLHYGFVAQEVYELLPDLVHEDDAGYLSMNYVELIPLLVKAVQELSAEVSELRGTAAKHTIRKHDENTATTLYQNNPNPFTENTRIDFVIPTDVAEAFLCIYNMAGTLLEKIALTARGEGSVTIEGKKLAAGIYVYALVTDGQVVDTKQMILTQQ